VNQIICIGDRFAGKTHLCLEILNPDGHYIKVSRWKSLNNQSI